MKKKYSFGTAGHDRRTFGILVAALVVGIAVQYGTLHAQLLDEQQETIHVIPGAVFEILAVQDLADAQVSWVLTEDRTFIEAGRNAVFRVRLTNPGTYTLDGGVFSPSQSVRWRKTMQIVVKPATQSLDASDASAGASTLPTELVRTNPGIQGDTIVMRPDGILTLIPVRTGEPLALDSDNERDGNGDGNPTNDPDGKNTFFETDGTPLHVWFASPRERRTLSVAKADGTATQRLTVLSQDRPVVVNEIVAQEKDSGDVAFSLQFRGGIPPSGPLLLHWFFGDGNESQLDTPIHRYERNGDFAVRVSVVSLQNGQSVLELQKNIVVTTAGSVPPPSESSASSVSSEGAEPANGSSLGGWMFLLLKVLFVVLVAMGAGALIVFVYKRIKGGGLGLQKKLEQVETTLVGKKTTPKDVIDVPAAPMELKRTSPKEMPTTPARSVSTDVAPAWLKKGLDETKKVETPAAAPKTAPIPPPPLPTATPKTVPVPTPAPTAKTSPVIPPPAAPKENKKDAELPPWLKESSTPPTAATPASVTPATPVEKPAAPPAVTAPIPAKPIEQPKRETNTTLPPFPKIDPWNQPPLVSQKTVTPSAPTNVAPVAPKIETAPTPAPVKAAPPVPAPVSTVETKPETKPIVAPSKLIPPARSVATDVSPTLIAKPTPTPIATPTPKPVDMKPPQAPPIAPNPNPNPNPNPTVSPKPIEQPIPKADSDEPIAIIKAESISKDQTPPTEQKKS